MKEVTDPALLDTLNATPSSPAAPQGLKEVTDPSLLQQLDDAPATTSVFGTPLPTPESPFEGQELVQGPTGPIVKGEARLPMSEPFQTLDDLTVAMINGLTFNTADEMKAAIFTALGTRPGETYAENVEIERRRDRDIGERSPVSDIAGRTVGGVLTGGTLAKGGVSLVAGAKPTLASMAGRGAAEGALYGAAHGAGAGEGLEGRGEGAVEGGALGGALGGLTGAFFWPFLRGAKPATLQSVKDESQVAYKAAEKAGLEITADSYGGAVDSIAAVARKAGIDPGIHPKASAALNRLQSEAGPKTLDDLTIYRRVLKAAAASNEADERRIGMLMVDAFDDYVVKLSPKAITAGDHGAAVKALNQARTLWSRYRKGETIMEAIDRAGVRAGQFSGSGYENALRTEFRSIAMNKKRLRGFTKAEQAAIRKVAMGGPIENVLRLLGKFAPKGVVSIALGSGVGYGLGGGPGIAAVMGAGIAGRRGATAMTKASAQRALEQMLSGKGAVTLTRKQADTLLAAIVAEQPVIRDALPTKATVPLSTGR